MPWLVPVKRLFQHSIILADSGNAVYGRTGGSWSSEYCHASFAVKRSSATSLLQSCWLSSLKDSTILRLSISLCCWEIWYSAAAVVRLASVKGSYAIELSYWVRIQPPSPPPWLLSLGPLWAMPWPRTKTGKGPWMSYPVYFVVHFLLLILCSFQRFIHVSLPQSSFIWPFSASPRLLTHQPSHMALLKILCTVFFQTTESGDLVLVLKLSSLGGFPLITVS